MEWDALPYLILSQETGFEMKLLKRFDVELMIGQILYQQKATRKVSFGVEQKEVVTKQSIHR